MHYTHFNFFAIGSIIGAIFSYYIAILFLVLKDKSKATFHLGFSNFWLALFHTGYAWGFIAEGPGSVYHKYLVIPGAMFGALEFSRFFIAYQIKDSKKLDKIVASILYTIAIGISIYYVFISFDAIRLYFPSAHYFDFKLHAFNKFYSIVVMVYFIVFAFFGIRNYRKVEKQYRFTTLVILASILFITILPGILNALSRDGAISREIYIIVVDLSVVIGLFCLSVVYINNTEDKTTIMSRITGITMATFLLVLQMVSYFAISDKEKTYDMQKYNQAKLALVDKVYPDDMKYIFVYDIKDGANSYLYKNSNELPDYKKSKNEILNTFLWSRIATIQSRDPEIFQAETKAILENSHPGFSGYKALVLDYLDRNKDNGNQLNASELLSYFDSLNRKITYNKNKLGALNESELASWIEKNRNSDNWLGVFVTGIVTNHEITDIASLTGFFAPFQVPESRRYRGDFESGRKDLEPEKYVSFLIPSIAKNIIYEVGFSYDAYMRYIDSLARILVYIIVGTIILVGVGFRFFFSGALVNPINDVVEGLKSVNSGDLTVRLKVKVEDEIGFMARSFNKMVRSIQAARKKLEEYAQDLEHKVEERTKELKLTLNEVQNLKTQQDGDYFLTSLLIKPLSSNHVTSDNVRVEFFIKQKKQFAFRKYQEEIGGDINIASSIRLRGRKFSAFLNADAMGKSMQGAGGALVIGSVFESIVERTKVSREAQNYFPERWLKNTFIELHKVFESFNGSMLISLVMGLVDDSTGIVYYINAEHPFTILFRDGKAEFIEQEFLYRKLGTAGVSGVISIRTFHMQPGDSLIAGSDGRDDIILETHDDGTRVINEDETLFLRILEKSNGDLNQSFENLLEIGPLSDDISLLKITYDPVNSKDSSMISLDAKKSYSRGKVAWQNNQLGQAIDELERALDLSDREPAILKKLGLMYLKARNYTRSKDVLLEYIDREPQDTESIFMASYSARKTGDYGIAVDLGERVRLRMPHYGENLLNLAKSHILLKNMDRAYGLLEEASLSLPEHPGIRKMLLFTKKRVSST
ncbi:SpoIIE family protein phosphatase [Leptospira sp. GIMC2001]|uniref:SpoIIE family protein phosphatase n=1 Tax=Leptospira sp. GIMC2001 TaxID=1513297 RepID=UPI00234A0893|nr:SpoIIE family protein phosphatase [Leptospira sp. GIMC2001]WCL50956.1 SpoIIE family protein phosphatase [Leptospira sp. GIMC2001]